jgi:hypothetical protein
VASRLSPCRAASTMRTLSLDAKSVITRSKRYLCYLYEFDMNHLPYSILTASNSNHYLLGSLLPVGRAEILRRGNAEKAWSTAADGAI